jgi:cbb3-type cytochrome oxidase cytochrome c subunit
MNKSYIKRKCHKCDSNLMVLSHDVSERYYCYGCAMSKMSVYDNRTGSDDMAAL